MSLESKMNYRLNKHPGIKKAIKRVYQRTMYTISPKMKSAGAIVRLSPDDPSHEYFFGYYDKSPWDATDRYVLCMRAKNTWSDVSPKEKADILLIDTSVPADAPERVRKIAETSSWNVQQGCMAQWLGPDFSSRVIYNDCRDGGYVAVILTVATGEEKVIPAPVYTVAADGKTALTLDFSRLYNLRPGYGYYNVPEATKGIALPDAPAVRRVDLETGETVDVLSYRDFAEFEPRPEMQEAGAVHKVNHLMISPNGKRCMVLYRWFVGPRKYTRLVTFNIDGSEMYLLSDDDMVSHCFWKDDDHILAFENKNEGGQGYYLMKDKTREYVHLWKYLNGDGHPSYSPDGRYVVTDSYPNRRRIASIRLLKDSEDCGSVVCKVFAPFKYDNDTRCDLHPRWDRGGKRVCFDSVFEGSRGLYEVNVGDMMAGDKTEGPLISVVVPIYNVSGYLRRCVDSICGQSYSNTEILLVNDGSTDDSLSVCEALAAEDRRIRIIDKKNGGLSSARNAGIAEAKGEFLLFIDADDYIHEDMIKRLYSLSVENDADIASCKFCKVYGEDCEVRSVSGQVFGVKCMTGEEALGKMFYPGGIGWSACNKIYRAELFENVRYVEGVYMEDMATTYKLYDICKRVSETTEELYYYFIRDDGITGSRSAKRAVDAIANIEEIIEFYKDRHPQLLPYAYGHYAKISPNFLVTLNSEKTEEPTQLKCIDALKRYKKYALKADFVKKKYKIIIRLFSVPVFFGGKRLVKSFLFHKFCKSAKKWIK